MKNRKTKKKDAQFVEILLSKAKRAPSYSSSSSLLGQCIENILAEGENDETAAGDLIKRLLAEFVDWNEVRIVSAERLRPLLEVSQTQQIDYKLKALQAFLNKIFSRSGTLDYQFLIDFDLNALEDYLSGITELIDHTRMRLVLRVFKLPVLPLTHDHGRIIERVGSVFTLGDEQMIKSFDGHPPEVLEGVKHFLDHILSKFCTESPKCARCPLNDLCCYAEEN